MIEDIMNELSERFDSCAERLRSELIRIRTGRANAGMLEGIRVDFYGTPTPLPQTATIKVPEPSMLTITPWDKSMLGAIERAINMSDLGLNPNNDGSMIRLSIPPLTQERRAELAKQVRRHGEDAKIALRAARRDANDMLKALEKDKDISEDEMHTRIAEVQKRTDDAVKRVEAIVSDKETEITEL